MDAAVQPRAVAQAQVPQRRAVGERLAVGEVEGEGETGDAEQLAQLPLDVDGGAGGVHAERGRREGAAEEVGSESEPDRPGGTAGGEELVSAACRETERREGGCGATGNNAAFADKEELRRRAMHSLGQQHREIEHCVGQTHIKTAFQPVPSAVESCVF